MTAPNPEHLRGVTARDGRFYAQYTTAMRNLHIGSYATPERAAIAARLFRYWCKVGYEPDSIPRTATSEPMAKKPDYVRVPDKLLTRAIFGTTLSTIDIINMAKEIKAQRILLYGRTRAEKM